jgi:hypothetical protein
MLLRGDDPGMRRKRIRVSEVSGMIVRRENDQFRKITLAPFYFPLISPDDFTSTGIKSS